MPTFLLIDKPKNITSFGVVAKLRSITGVKKIGHAGTLDPNATGLLIVGIGREATKRLHTLTNNTNKTYTAELFLGEERDTDDIEGAVTKTYKITNPPTKKLIQKTLNNYIGEITQTPPIYSAIKIKGRKAYELARKGEIPDLKKRKIQIHNIKLIKYSYPKLIIETKVSSGTYIRALAKDIGADLDTGAYLRNLRRTEIGKYNVTKAVKLSEINKNNWSQHTITHNPL